ncbi:hypothetical protein AVEN_160608-1 [Araneus ventricosus]|uniref:Uncharacterized protein n=1 Tax=Araneus ventricosus TaxID=182803 RepID=A0A4Y2K378_ARAVE|nr:hypothetical protein AVEN_160608-1 [Araneus ventricosus]
MKFGGPSTGQTVPTGNTSPTGNRSPKLLRLLLLPPFSKRFLHPDFHRMTPTPTYLSPLEGFRFCERGSVPLTNYRISVLWPSAPKDYKPYENPTVFPELLHFSSDSYIGETFWHTVFQKKWSGLLVNVLL